MKLLLTQKEINIIKLHIASQQCSVIDSISNKEVFEYLEDLKTVYDMYWNSRNQKDVSAIDWEFSARSKEDIAYSIIGHTHTRFFDDSKNIIVNNYQFVR